ncbi:hypothetical protein FF38_09206 [Lucilia cuprina]|uniref:Uncharacterized protein n=1 Tax=Lucilia cuprina TaxID=7375 RepID=A0A0L0BRG3_LUCCU|nr:hypothetical protein FF38_09206 [Lucilia cuprina]
MAFRQNKKIHSGCDNYVRVVDVRTKGGNITRHSLYSSRTMRFPHKQLIAQVQ